MKKNISALVILISLIASAQNTTIIEQYCDMVVTNAPFSRKLNITLDLGQERPKRFKDAKLKDNETGKPKQFNTVMML